MVHIEAIGIIILALVVAIGGLLFGEDDVKKHWND